MLFLDVAMAFRWGNNSAIFKSLRIAITFVTVQQSDQFYAYIAKYIAVNGRSEAE